MISTRDYWLTAEKDLIILKFIYILNVMLYCRNESCKFVLQNVNICLVSPTSVLIDVRIMVAYEQALWV